MSLCVKTHHPDLFDELSSYAKQLYSSSPEMVSPYSASYLVHSLIMTSMTCQGKNANHFVDLKCCLVIDALTFSVTLQKISLLLLLLYLHF